METRMAKCKNCGDYVERSIFVSDDKVSCFTCKREKSRATALAKKKKIVV